MNIKNIDFWRRSHMAIAEWVDTWRLTPRLLVIGYAYMTWSVVQWYMSLEPTMIVGCNVEVLKEACIAAAPTTSHSIVLTAVVGVAAAVFGLYTGSGKKWDGFIPWNKKEDVTYSALE